MDFTFINLDESFNLRATCALVLARAVWLYEDDDENENFHNVCSLFCYNIFGLRQNNLIFFFFFRQRSAYVVLCALYTNIYEYFNNDK